MGDEHLDTGQAAPAQAGPEDDAELAGPTSRRRLLRMGALSASVVVTIRPAIAQAASSVMNCQIPIPDPARGGSYISAQGDVVAPGTPGAFPPAPRPLTGEEVKAMMTSGQRPAGVDPEAAQAYTQYISRLQRGQSGFTCYASLQMPRP